MSNPEVIIVLLNAGADVFQYERFPALGSPEARTEADNENAYQGHRRL